MVFCRRHRATAEASERNQTAILSVAAAPHACDRSRSHVRHAANRILYSSSVHAGGIDRIADCCYAAHCMRWSLAFAPGCAAVCVSGGRTTEAVRMLCAAPHIVWPALAYAAWHGMLGLCADSSRRVGAQACGKRIRTKARRRPCSQRGSFGVELSLLERRFKMQPVACRVNPAPRTQDTTCAPQRSTALDAIPIRKP